MKRAPYPTLPVPYLGHKNAFFSLFPRQKGIQKPENLNNDLFSTGSCTLESDELTPIHSTANRFLRNITFLFS